MNYSCGTKEFKTTPRYGLGIWVNDATSWENKVVWGKDGEFILNVAFELVGGI